MTRSALTLVPTTLATRVFSRRASSRPHALLVPAFVSLTAPVTTIFLMRAVVFRRRVAVARDALARGEPPMSGDPARGQRNS